MRRWLLVVLLCVLVASCGHASANQVAAQTPTSASHTIVLVPGQSGRVEDTPLSITVDAIVEDSRCPKGVECVWAGDVVVKLLITGTPARETEATLHLNVAPRVVVYEGHRLTLADVAPYPVEGEQISPDQYRVTLRIEKR